MNKEITASIVVATLVIMASTAWYFAWVKPNTERMYTIMDCMTEINDHTQAGYNRCASRLNEAG